MPGMAYSSLSKMMAPVKTYFGGLLRPGHAEDLSLMLSDHTCTHSSSTRRADNLVYVDPEIWKAAK